MKFCVFGAASAHVDEVYIKAVEELGEKMAKRGHSLVFGAGSTGLMGAAARGVKRAGGYVHGVIPHFFKEHGVEVIFDDCDKLTFTEDMAQRKNTMENECDAFIIVPGGVGTFEEFFQVLTLKQLGRHKKAIAIYDINGFFIELEKFLQEVAEKKFVTYETTKLYKFFNSADELLTYLEGYKFDDENWKKFKMGG
ncbi:MAG: TIGR00730 family Rossman fold protein [Clostridia bacterium]|nr:TIGR00730 family Rossman fold protein [Clostridia bacterium]